MEWTMRQGLEQMFSCQNQEKKERKYAKTERKSRNEKEIRFMRLKALPTVKQTKLLHLYKDFGF